MIVWFLLICASSDGSLCQPPVQMPNEKSCTFMANQYRIVTNGYGRFRCVGIRK